MVCESSLKTELDIMKAMASTTQVRFEKMLYLNIHIKYIYDKYIYFEYNINV